MTVPGRIAKLPVLELKQETVKFCSTEFLVWTCTLDSAVSQDSDLAILVLVPVRDVKSRLRVVMIHLLSRNLTVSSVHVKPKRRCELGNPLSMLGSMRKDLTK